MPRGRIFILALMLLFMSCGAEQDHDLVLESDYELLLESSQWESTEQIQSEIAFWSARLRPDSSGLGELGPLAAAYSKLYDVQGDYNHLISTETLLRKAVSIAAVDRSSYVRALSANLIKQHRFTDALNNMLEQANLDQLEVADHYVLFDCYLEVGRPELAKDHLDQSTDRSDLAYLIRLARYLDHEGDLPAAIRQLEQASRIAKSRNQDELILWTTSNLADFYVHDGRLEQAYQHYLESLALKADHVHSWRGIAWLAYSVDGNTDQARAILDQVSKVFRSPAVVYDLMELSRFENNQSSIDSLQQAFIAQTSVQAHGNLFSIPRAYELLEKDPQVSEQLVKAELLQRNTPEVQVLNASINAQVGKPFSSKALLSDLLKGSTEPLTLYRAARLFGQMEDAEAVKQLKEALTGTSVELGPYKMRVLEGL